MSKKPKDKDMLSSADKKVWQAVTDTVTPLGERPEAPELQPAPRGIYIRETSLPDGWFTSETPAPKAGFDRKTRRNIVKGRQEFDRSVDLHGMTQDNAFSTLQRVIEGCVRRGDKTILVVTGKGGARFSQTAATTPVAYRTRRDFDNHSGVLKRMVPLWLAGADLKPFVHSYAPAAQEHGGEGALYVILRRRMPGSSKGGSSNQCPRSANK